VGERAKHKVHRRKAVINERVLGELAAADISASDAVGLSFLRCGSRKTRVAHRRMKIERVYRPYLTATEAVCRYIPISHLFYVPKSVLD
jgi:hypothetical protein